MKQLRNSIQLLNMFNYNVRLVLASISRMPVFLPKSPQPLIATINFTENCNSKCRSCTYWHNVKSEEITTERAKGLLVELAKNGIRYIRIMGGEPLLRKDLFEILSSVSNNLFNKVVLCTNGLLLDKFADEINQSCITNISVSLDGIGSRNDYLRGVDGHFEAVIKGLRAVHGKRVKVVSVLTKFLALDIEELLNLCRVMGFDYDICLLNHMQPFSSTSTNMAELWPSEDDARFVFDKMVSGGIISHAIAKGSMDWLSRSKYPSARCIQGYLYLIVRNNGDVHIGDYELPAIGNVLLDPLKNILCSNVSEITARKLFALDDDKSPCGWQVDHAYSHPWQMIPYIVKRLSTTPVKPS